MKPLIRAAEADIHHPLGGKARALAALRSADFTIPEWVALSPEAFTASLTPPQRDALQAARDGEVIRALVEQVQACPEVGQELRSALSDLCPNRELVAVRSSASDEDGVQHSFAGQLDSFLFVPPEQVADRVMAVWRSAFGERIVAYRREHGLDPLPRAPAVLIQRMIDAETAGVAFGADPVSGRRDVAVVSAVYGLGTALVSGDADAYHFSRGGAAWGAVQAWSVARFASSPTRATPLCIWVTFSSPSAPIPAGSCSSRARPACSSSAAVCCRTRPSSLGN